MEILVLHGLIYWRTNYNFTSDCDGAGHWTNDLNSSVHPCQYMVASKTNAHRQIHVRIGLEVLKFEYLIEPYTKTGTTKRQEQSL